jgi:hypothetical protein
MTALSTAPAYMSLIALCIEAGRSGRFGSGFCPLEG